MSRFTLAGLLRLRGVEEDRAAAALGDAERQRTEAEDLARRTADRLSGAELPGQADGPTWLAAAASRLTLSALLTEDTERVADAQSLVAERHGEWAQARQAERSVERLEEHHVERERLDDLRTEQRALDEIAGRRAEEDR